MLNSIVSKVYSNQQTSFSIIDVKSLKIRGFYSRKPLPDIFSKLLRIHFTPTWTPNCLHDGALRQRPERRTTWWMRWLVSCLSSFKRQDRKPRARRQGPGASSYCDDQGGQRAVTAADRTEHPGGCADANRAIHRRSFSRDIEFTDHSTINLTTPTHFAGSKHYVNGDSGCVFVVKSFQWAPC